MSDELSFYDWAVQENARVRAEARERRDPAFQREQRAAKRSGNPAKRATVKKDIRK